MIFFENDNDEMNFSFNAEDNHPHDFYSFEDDNRINPQDSNENNGVDDNHFINFDFDACQKFPNPSLLFEGQSFYPTEPNSKDNHLNQKRCREETEYYEQNDNVLVEEKEENKIEVKECEEKTDEKDEQKEEKAEEKSTTNKKEKNYINNNINNNTKARGRRKKDESYDDEPEHDKFKPDNIIQKIKTFYFKYVLELLNNSLKDNHYKFYPLDKTLNVNLKKDFNEDLMNRTIYDIFMNSELNERHKNGDYSNKNLINKILEENCEIKTIKILKLKYIDVLNYIRQNDRKNFLEKIRAKEQKNKGITRFYKSAHI
jgi:hypothetical protein